MKMIREANGVVAYTWVENGDESHWEKVGDVLGGTNKLDSGKTTYEGQVNTYCTDFNLLKKKQFNFFLQAYDFVFSVDVEDGKPPLKLPYNTGEDPYQAAQKFLSKNLLPSGYLEQVDIESFFYVILIFLTHNIFRLLILF